MEYLDSQSCLRRELCFYSEPSEGESPRYLVKVQDGGLGHRNYEHQRLVVPIRDIRGAESTFSLNVQSFAALSNVYDESNNRVDFDNVEQITNNFLVKAGSILQNHLGKVKFIVPFDYQVRRASRIKAPNRQVHKIHVDQSPIGAIRRARRELSDSVVDNIESTSTRLRIINLWKPIEGSVKDHPLTFADCRSLDPSHLVAVPQIYPDYTGETYAIRHDENQKFWYWSNMSVRDVLFLQCFDSDAVDKQKGIPYGQCAHGTFRLRDDGEESYDRASIEVRFLVIG